MSASKAGLFHWEGPAFALSMMCQAGANLPFSASSALCMLSQPILAPSPDPMTVLQRPRAGLRWMLMPCAAAMALTAATAS
ncbi:MAG: hypothetical protein QM690_14085, partial [Sphingobium sp.]